MTSRTGPPVKQLPEDFAARLRALQKADNPLLNALLDACRNQDWPAPSLAAGLGMNPAAISKRVQRAREHAAQARAGDPARVAQMARIAPLLETWEIPPVPQVHATLDGKKLSPDEIRRLSEMQAIASRVNGAMPAGHPDRRVSEQFSDELAELIEHQGLTPYYLSLVLGVSHRAITSRLERHHYRTPPPSVTGTSSGEYYGRKIGDDGQGALRLTPEQRTELREAWAKLADLLAAGPLRPPVRRRNQLVRLLRTYLDQGFTLANLAQAMNTRDHRVRFTELQQLVAMTRRQKAVPA